MYLRRTTSWYNLESWPEGRLCILSHGLKADSACWVMAWRQTLHLELWSEGRVCVLESWPEGRVYISGGGLKTKSPHVEDLCWQCLPSKYGTPQWRILCCELNTIGPFMNVTETCLLWNLNRFCGCCLWLTTEGFGSWHSIFISRDFFCHWVPVLCHDVLPLMHEKFYFERCTESLVGCFYVGLLCWWLAKQLVHGHCQSSQHFTVLSALALWLHRCFQGTLRPQFVCPADRLFPDGCFVSLTSFNSSVWCGRCTLARTDVTLMYVRAAVCSMSDVVALFFFFLSTTRMSYSQSQPYLCLSVAAWHNPWWTFAACLQSLRKAWVP